MIRCVLDLLVFAGKHGVTAVLFLTPLVQRQFPVAEFSAAVSSTWLGAQFQLHQGVGRPVYCITSRLISSSCRPPENVKLIEVSERSPQNNVSGMLVMSLSLLPESAGKGIKSYTY